MDLGSEISKQIKSAIKNKLQELGSYVDDELPEYIMVMLSNKRSKKQMTEDLMLFLGENTVKFIDWLTNLVEKLKDVASLVESAEESVEVVSEQQEILDSTPEKQSPPSKNDGKEHTSKKKETTREKRKSPSRSTVRDSHHPKSSKIASSRSERSKASSSSSSRQSTLESKHSSSKKRKLSESDDEEIQAGTHLSSVVKVQEKRPTLPTARQATGSLLRRAVAEAHMSVTKVMHSLTYDPTSPPSPKKVQSLEEKKQQKEILLQQHRELQKQLQTKEFEESTSNQEQSESDYYVASEREDTESEQTTQEITKVQESDLINEPVIELQVSEAEAEELNAELAQGDKRIVAFADSQSSTTTEEDKHKRKRKRAVKSRDRPRSPKFIVTLDGVDSELEDKFEKQSKTRQKPKKSQAEFDDFVEIDTSNMSFAPQTEIPDIAENKPTPPAVEEVMFTLDAASDDEDGQQMQVVSQPQEKCKFWPDCMNGPNCPFYHPSAPCRTFPNCKFADKCLFIHPLCKFDGRCVNVLCPFLHKNKLKVKAPPMIKTKPPPPPVPAVLQVDEALPVLAQITPCKFFPGCTRSNCPFLHPKPTITKVCRYGSICSRVDCMFTHPPSKAALKWVAPSTHISERSFALSEDKVTKTPVAS